MGIAMVNGLQNQGNFSQGGVVAEIKHFTQHGSPAGGKYTVDLYQVGMRHQTRKEKENSNLCIWFHFEKLLLQLGR